VPLLRPGLKPNGPYTVSFVYLHAGQPFAKRGEANLMLPQMDVPVTVLEWELFLPDRFSAKASAGNVMPAHLVEYTLAGSPGATSGVEGVAGGIANPYLKSVVPGQILGQVVDPTGAVIPGATITLTASDGTRFGTVTDVNGRYVIDGVPSGNVVVTSELPGFSQVQRSFAFDQRPRQLDFRMNVAGASETVTVQAEVPLINTQNATRDMVVRRDLHAGQNAAMERREEAPSVQAPSANVLNLQRRVAGVLPVRVDVPRAGTAYKFVKPLVLDEEARVSFRYKRK
jgi:hypothetical protein